MFHLPTPRDDAVAFFLDFDHISTSHTLKLKKTEGKKEGMGGRGEGEEG